MANRSISELFSDLYDSSNQESSDEDSREEEMEWQESMPDSHIVYDIREA